MCHYRRYMYIWSSALLKRVASVCAIITDTGIYCRQRQFMQTTIYAEDNSCNMYCRQRQFMQATIYAVTDLHPQTYDVDNQRLSSAKHTMQCIHNEIYTKIPEVNLFAFAYRLFRRDFSHSTGYIAIYKYSFFILNPTPARRT